jgi:hypothetical protein
MHHHAVVRNFEKIAYLYLVVRKEFFISDFIGMSYCPEVGSLSGGAGSVSKEGTKP